jgi:hypothetical protein
MNTPTQYVMSILICLSLSCSNADAQQRIVFQVLPEWIPTESGQTGGAFARDQQDLSKGMLDPLAGGLLRVAELFTKDVFKVPSLRFRRAISYRDSIGDNFVVEWSFDEPFAAGTLTLRDTPYASQYAMRLDKGSWRSQADLSALLSGLVSWSARPIRVGALDIKVPPSFPSVMAFSGGPSGHFTEAVFIRDFFVTGWSDGNHLDLGFSIGKLFTEAYYPVAAFVPERFPTLTELAKSWNSRKVLDEVGKVTDPSILFDFSDRRDVILITELARRGLKDEEFANLLVQVPAKRLQLRADVLIQALDNAGMGDQFPSYANLAIGAYEHIGPAAKDAVTRIFQHLIGKRMCSTRFEGEAIRLLRAGAFQEGPIRYLSECSTSEDAINAIEKAALPRELVSLRDLSLLRIARKAERKKTLK